MVAEAPRAPVRISQQMPNALIPQGHRVPEWALEHIAARIRAGHAVCPDEPILKPVCDFSCGLRPGSTTTRSCSAWARS